MTTERRMSKAEASSVLRRLGFGEERIHDLFDELDDPIDFDRDSLTLLKYGLTRNNLTNLMGGSP